MVTTHHSTVPRTALGILAAIGLLFSMFAMAAPAAADAPGNNGTVKIHEGSTEMEPIVANDPHVCTFHLHFFFGDDVQAGDWWIDSWPPTGDGTTVLSGTYDATGGEDRQPRETDDPDVFTLPDGHYKLFWEGATNPGGVLNIKHKVFWVDCTPEDPPSQSASAKPSQKPSAKPSEKPDGAALNIFKLIEGTNTRLPGAIFEIDGMDGTFVSDENGQICITGLPKNSEWLVREIQAPEGYEIIEAEQLVEVDNDGDCNSPDARFYNRPVDEEPSQEPSEEPSVDASEEPSVDASESEAPAAVASQSPRDGVLGGNPTPGGGTIPDTALGSMSLPAWPFALLFLMSLTGLLVLRLSSEEYRSR